VSLFDVDISFPFRQRVDVYKLSQSCVDMSALALKVMCPCLKEPRFVIVEAATSFQDVHAMFFKQTELQSAIQAIEQLHKHAHSYKIFTFETNTKEI